MYTIDNLNNLSKIKEESIVFPVIRIADQTPSELRFKEYISSFNKFLIFSPHLDDAVLSMGSLLTYLSGLNKNIKVINIFTVGSTYHSTFNERLLRQASSSTAIDYFNTRRKEDKKAIVTIGNIHIKNLGLIDAAWRADRNNNLFYTLSIIGDIKQEDREVIRKLESILNNIEYISNDTLIFAPLARGRHIDHQIVRNSVLNVFKNVIHYCDFPYSNKYQNEDQFITDCALSRIEWRGDYNSKKRAILKYASQKVSLFQPCVMQLVYETFYLRFPA